jgi:hypothetical protein
MSKKLLLIVIAFSLFIARLSGQTEQLVVNISSAASQGILTFENPKGSIKVTGYEGEVILVTGTLRFSESEKPLVDGMRKIGQNQIDISAEVKGNDILIQSAIAGKTVDFDIKVPRKFSLKLKSLDNGNVEIINVNGEIVIENSNGDITLENVSGSAVLSTVYGNISANFREVSIESPMMFTSFEGDISITLPSTVNAKLKMKSEKGEILSDFDIKPAGRQPVVKNVENKQVYSLENWVVGSINSGGPEYTISSYTGNIILKKK